MRSATSKLNLLGYDFANSCSPASRQTEMQ